MNTEIERINKALNIIIDAICKDPSTYNFTRHVLNQVREDLNQPTQPEGGTFAEVVKETELQEYKKTHQLVNPLKDSSDKWGKLNKELDDKLSSISDEDLFKWYAENRAKKETKADKELLMECRDKIKNLTLYTEASHFVVNGFASQYAVRELKVLLPKLNKHLNHEPQRRSN